MGKMKLPPDVLELFRKQGRIGGKKAASNMTAQQRVARAKKAHNSLTAAERHERALKAVRARERKRKILSRDPDKR